MGLQGTLMTPFAGPHCVSYFKRFKMELELWGEQSPPSPLPPGHTLVPWHEGRLSEHAEALFVSFHETIDAVVFPSLGDRSGCYFLMTEIARKNGFLPGATWLLCGPGGYCGTVQGVRDAGGVGAIQNLGITPGCRNRGLGSLLLEQALEGFRRAGLKRALLEVTAQNEGAIRLYRRLGFRRRKTVYKAVMSQAGAW
jgi:ribosomal protein S18 acetylase RimI-like enzyme